MIGKNSAAPKPVSTLPSNDNNISSKTTQSSSFIQKDYDITTPEHEPMELNASIFNLNQS